MKKNKPSIPRCILYTRGIFMLLLSEAVLAELSTPAIAAFSAQQNMQIPEAWEPYQFDNIATTQYRIVKDNNDIVLMADSNNSASGLIQHIRFNPHEYPYISWRWKTIKPLAHSNAQKKSGDDYALRLYVNFDYDIDSLPYGEQFKIRLYKKLKGDNAPLASLNYIREKTLDKETIIASPYTKRVQMLVLQNQQSALNEWHFEQRNIVDDYKKAFGEAPKDVISIAIMSDSDNTQGSTRAMYGDIRISKTPANILPR